MRSVRRIERCDMSCDTAILAPCRMLSGMKAVVHGATNWWGKMANGYIARY